MTEAQAIEALTQRWIDAWPGLQPATPYHFEGEVVDSAATWVRVSFRDLTRTQATMGPAGGRRFETRGAINVQLFVDIGRGVGPLAALVDSVRAVYESREIATELITYGAVPLAAVNEERWTTRTVRIPFWFDEQR